VIRTVWLGLIFLVVLVGVGSFRFAFGHFDVANASGFIRPEGDRTAAAKAIPAPLTNDRLPIMFAFAPPELEIPKSDHIPAEPISRPVRAIESPRIIGRHWHDPSSSAYRQASGTRSKQKHKTAGSNADKSQATAEPKACQMLEFDAVRLALGMPTGCHI
jgi:hypothetical protein